MERKDIRGWTWRAFGYCVEFVTVHHVLRVIAVYNKSNRVLVRRFEL